MYRTIHGLLSNFLSLFGGSYNTALSIWGAQKWENLDNRPYGIVERSMRNCDMVDRKPLFRRSLRPSRHPLRMIGDCLGATTDRWGLWGCRGLYQPYEVDNWPMRQFMQKPRGTRGRSWFLGCRIEKHYSHTFEKKVRHTFAKKTGPAFTYTYIKSHSES